MLIDYIEQDQGYDQRHGGPWDRGSADAYYHRLWEPHYYRGNSYSSERVEMADMTAEEIVAYTAGYNGTTDRKDWG